MRAWLLSTPEPCCEQASASGTATTTPFTSAKFTWRLKERKLLMDSNGVAVVLRGGRQAVLKREKAASGSLALPWLVWLSLSDIPWGSELQQIITEEDLELQA